MPLRFRFEEEQTCGLWLTYGLEKVLNQERTPYQELAVVQTEALGCALILDGAVQTTEKDEFFYHEMMTHVPMFAHPCPRRILVIGGGDGGVVREVLKHPEVERVDLVEIDARVVENARTFLPSMAAHLDDPRVHLIIQDGVDFVKAYARDRAGAYDVAIIDSTDPIGPAAGLFRPEFYAGLAATLGPDGLFTCQVDSPVFCPEVVVRACLTVRDSFPIVRPYVAPVPTFPAGWWGYVAASHGPDPGCPVGVKRFPGMDTKYYTPDTHRAAFALPRYLEQMLGAAGLTVRAQNGGD
ncbi:MAG TPA: polyamine aminopropyltransferase [Firmicutes bacterium]|nr:polyamine aminopropyltransferase [Bacillota bacterium]